MIENYKLLKQTIKKNYIYAKYTIVVILTLM